MESEIKTKNRQRINADGDSLGPKKFYWTTIVVFLLIGMGLAISVLGSALYFATRPNYDRIDNDLKYRYIKMKGEATPERISELENLFGINRDNAKIRQMNKDVEDYERAVKKKAALDEQARLRQREAKKLNQEVEKLKNK